MPGRNRNRDLNLTYGQLYSNLQADARGGSRIAVSQLMTVASLMQTEGADKVVDQNIVSNRSVQLMRSSSFRNMMNERDAKPLWEAGNGIELNKLMADVSSPQLSYRKYINLTTLDAQQGSPMAAANLIAAETVLAGGDRYAAMDTNAVSRTAAELINSKAFSEVMKDPRTLDLMKAGKSQELKGIFDEKQNPGLQQNGPQVNNDPMHPQNNDNDLISDYDSEIDEADNEPLVFRNNFEGANNRRQQQPQNRRNRRLNIVGENDNQQVRNENQPRPGNVQQHNANDDPNVIPNYLEYVEQLKASEEAKEKAAAHMMAAFMTMPPAGGNMPVNMDEINKTAARLMKQEAFKLMMEDPSAEKLLHGGHGIELIGLMAEKQEIVDAENARYQRGKEKADKDVTFLNDAINSFNEGEAGKKPAELEKQNKYFKEMNKHLDHARMLAGIGEPLSGVAAKNLVIATQKYLDGGTKLAGGKKPAAASKTAMCILAHYMPPEDFKAYCQKVSANPLRTSRRDVDPAHYTHGRLMGVEKTPQEMRKEYGTKLKSSFSKENVASVVAVNNLMKKKNGGLITVVDVDEERKRLLSDGSAFNKAWSDPQNREKYKNITNEGSYALLGREVTRDSDKHTVKAAQGVINRSIRKMVSTPLNQFFAAEHISNILAAKAFAAQADAGTNITNKEFKDHMEMFRRDPFVLQLSSRYARDPEFRKKINHDLASNNSGNSLLDAYNDLKNPPKPEIQRNVQNEAPQNEGVQNNGRRLNQRQQQVMNQIDNLQMPFA